MAMPGQPPVQGGLGAMSPKPEGAPPPPSGDKDAARISAMEQEAPMSADDVARKSLMDRQQQSLALEQQIQLLTKSLDSRLNPGFDTPLMAMAAGFLKPTKTGSFGESLGYGMENYSKESENEFARKQMADKQRLEYMKQLADLQAQRGITDFRLQRMAPDQTVLRTGAEGMPANAPGAAPVGGGAAPVAEGAATAPTQPIIQGLKNKPITLDMLEQAYALDTTGKTGKEFEEIYKLQQEQIKIQRGQLISTPDGMFNVDTQKYMPLDPYLDKPLEAPVPYVGNQKITQRISKEIDALDAKFPPGNPAREDEFAKYYARRGIGDVKYTPAVPGKPASVSGMQTPSEKKNEELQSAENIKTQTPALQKSKDKIYMDSENARPMLNSAKFVYNFATNPATQGAFGVLSQGDVGGAIGTLVSEGLSTPGGGIKVAGIENAVRLIKGTPAEVAAAQQVASNYAELELAYRNKYYTGTGGGAISDKEQAVVQRIGGGLSDTAKVAAAKAEIVEARGRLDQALGDKLYAWEQQNPNKAIQHFRQSPEVKKLLANFDNQMDKLYNKYYGDKPAAQGSQPAAPTTARPEARPPATAPSAPPIVNGDDDPAYKNLKPGQQYIYNGQVKTKK